MTRADTTLRRVAAFCGSSPGARPEYTALAQRFGCALAERGIELVYGGAHVGLMGAVADTALAAGGRVTGVIPRQLVELEIAHIGLTELHVVESMHERKALTAELADAFVALPGGLGTLEEIFEVLTWAQLSLHAKPCALLDAAGYFAPLAAFLDRAVSERFLRPEHRAMILVDDDPETLIERLAGYKPPVLPKWMDRAAT